MTDDGREQGAATVTSLTAESLTDEMILALRNRVAPMDTPRPRHERTAEDLAIIDACDYALTPYPEYAEKRSAARLRCAEILNARAAATPPTATNRRR